jgi:hypothetical protein
MGFYSTNNAKFSAYKMSRRKEQEYYEDQQDELDEKLAEERGDIVMASRYAKLAKSVINAFGDQVQQKAPGTTAKATDYLGELITTGRLSQAFDAIKKMGLEGLSPAAQEIVKDIQNPITRKAITSDFNSNLERIAIENATPEQRAVIGSTAKAEADALRKAAKNPGLAEAVAARARKLAETRDITAYENLGGKRPRNNDLLNAITDAKANLKPRSAPGSPKLEEAKQAFISAIGGNEEAVGEVVGKAVEGLTIDPSAAAPKEEKPKAPSKKRSPTGKDILDKIKLLNNEKNAIPDDRMSILQAYAENPKGNAPDGTTKKNVLKNELAALTKTQSAPKPSLNPTAAEFKVPGQ